MRSAAAPKDKFYLAKRTRSFVYLSSAKVEPLYSQIKEPIRKKIAVTLGIGTPTLPVGPYVEAHLPAQKANLAGMLGVVLSNLDKAGDIGTIDEPGPYFAGQLTLRWGRWKEFLFLSGSTAHTLVALTGSNRHLIGASDQQLPTVSWAASSSVGLDRVLQSIFEGDDQIDDDNNPSDIVKRLALANRNRGGPQENLEFVARRLARGEVFFASNERPGVDFEQLSARDYFNALLGTPLYLAYAD
jgi:hypothetical protein